MEENQEIQIADPIEPDAQPKVQELTPEQRWIIVLIIVISAAILVISIIFAVALYNAGPATTAALRDIFIIFMALESMVIGVALVILIIQLSVIINLLQNELRPIIHSTNQTVNTLRGTVAFLSDNLTEPIITLNEYMAGVKKFFDLLRPGR
jgi:hypothetical protein